MRCSCSQCKTRFFYASADMKTCPVCGAEWVKPITTEILDKVYQQMESSHV